MNSEQLTKLKQSAQAAAETSQLRRACHLLRKALKIKPDCRDCWAALGHCSLLRHKYATSLRAYKRAEELLNGQIDCEVSYGLGLLHLHCGQHSEAEQALQAVLKARPTFEQKDQVLFKLGVIQQAQNRSSKAIFFLRNVLGSPDLSSEDKTEAMCQLGLCYWKLGKASDAVETFKEAEKMNPNTFRVKLCLGWSLLMRKDAVEAQRTLHKALHLARSPWQEFQAYYWLGRSQLHLRNYCSSQMAFKEALALHPTEPRVWNSVGVLYAQAGQLQNAFDCFAKAVKLSPRSGPSRKNLGVYWANLGVLFTLCGSRSEAEQALANACVVDPVYEQFQRSVADSGLLEKFAHNQIDDPFVTVPEQTRAESRRLNEQTPKGNALQRTADIGTKQNSESVSDQGRIEERIVLPSVPGLRNTLSHPAPNPQHCRVADTQSQLQTTTDLPVSRLPGRSIPAYSPRPQSQVWTIPGSSAAPQNSANSPEYLDFWHYQGLRNLGCSSARYMQQFPYMVGVHTSAQFQPQMPAHVFNSTLRQWSHHTNPISGFMRSMNLMTQAKTLANGPGEETPQKRSPHHIGQHSQKKKK